MLTTAPWALALGFALGAHAGWFCPGHQHAASVEVVSIGEELLLGDDDDPCTQARRDREIDRLRELGRQVRRTSETQAVPQELFAALTEDPWMLARFARAKLVSRDGEPYGFRVSLHEPGGLVRELGLREGDVVTHINGQALESTEDLREAVDGLRGLDEVSITVERKGSPLQKRYVVD